MKNLAFKLAFPLSVISFAVITKWWYAMPVDAPETMFTGFPLAYSCRGWHTSLSLQVFVIEFLIDFLFYFLCWLIVLYVIDRFVRKLKANRIMTISLWSLSGIIICLAIWIAANKDNLFYFKRPFDMRVLETGCQFLWHQPDWPYKIEYFPKTW
jgi:hypothetical protein